MGWFARMGSASALRNVPFVESRSTSAQLPSGWRIKTAWRWDTPVSSSAPERSISASISLVELCRPILTWSPVSRNRRVEVCSGKSIPSGSWLSKKARSGRTRISQFSSSQGATTSGVPRRWPHSTHAVAEPGGDPQLGQRSTVTSAGGSAVVMGAPQTLQ